jgi:hypothetical protein
MDPILRIESWSPAVPPVDASARTRPVDRERRRRDQREADRRAPRREDAEPGDEDERPHVDVTA